MRVPERRVDRGGGRRVVDRRHQLDLRGQVAECFVQHGAHLGGTVAGQGSDVDLEVDAIRDHVDLRAAVGDGRRERRVGARLELASHAHRECIARVAEAVGIEQRVDELVRIVHPLDEPTPDVVDLRAGLVLGEPLDHGGGRDEGVVGLVGLGAVAGRARDAQLGPVAPLLGHDHRQLQARGAGDRDPPGLGDHEVGPDGVRLVLDEVAGPERAEGLLVRDGQVDQGPPGPEAARGQPLRGDRHRRGEVQHVDGAAPPHLAVDELAAEGIVLPPVGVHGDHVGVAHQEHRGRVGVGAFDARDEARSSRRGFEPLTIEPAPFEVGLEQIRAAHLVARGVGAVVHARVSDEVLQKIGHLVGHETRPYARVGLFIAPDLMQHPTVHRAPLVDLQTG